jgi:glycosyltransferase involved in cell wall biosynthesis
MTTLYLCYQSLLDPLTSSQVVGYLEGLARVGYQPILVTFEPRALDRSEHAMWQNRLHTLGIRWRVLRYHRRPTIPATAFDILAGIILSLWLVVRFRISLVHARSHVSALMAAVVRIITGVPFLFDIRGLLAEEYVDCGVWPPNGFLFCATKRAERSLVARASGIVVLTAKAKALFQTWYPRELAGKPIVVIPCCVDLRNGSPSGLSTAAAMGGSTPRSPTLVYVGKLGGRYPTRAMVELFAAARRRLPGLRWQILTQSDTAELETHARRLSIAEAIDIGRVEYCGLRRALERADMAMCLNRADRSAVATSPTKIADYLAAGLPVVASLGTGDVDRILSDPEDGAGSGAKFEPVGILIDERDPCEIERGACEIARLMHDPTIKDRCRRAAAYQFDLETVGWARYQRLYSTILRRARAYPRPTTRLDVLPVQNS